AIYLHGSVLHILFNLLWIRQLGPAVEELYGPARLVVICTGSGALGFVASNLGGVPFTIGASGAIFGLLGAMVAYGRKRGGVFGGLILRQYGQWALLLFIMGFFMSGVNNFAHAGGFIGGLAAGLVLSFEDQRGESGFDRLLATACILLTVVGFALSLWTTFSRASSRKNQGGPRPAPWRAPNSAKGSREPTASSRLHCRLDCSPAPCLNIPWSCRSA